MSDEHEFAEFWKRYPRRIGKLAALKAYRKARTLASAQELLDGVERYKTSKPSYADWCHPSTWLNQGRWLDDVGPAVSEWECLHPEPKCTSRWRCHQRTALEAFKRGPA